MDSAACRGMDVNLFFPEDRKLGRSPDHIADEAKAVCAPCEVRTACLAYAHRHCIQYGIYGGATVRERRQMRRKKVA